MKFLLFTTTNICGFYLFIPFGSMIKYIFEFDELILKSYIILGIIVYISVFHY